MVLAATKNLSTEAMSKFSQAKDNHFQLLYFPFHGVVSALRTMLAISGAKYTFAHPEVRARSFFFFLGDQLPSEI